MIKKSIRNKLFIYVIAIVVSFVVAVVVFNQVFLPEFYLQRKREVLIEQAQIVDDYQVTDYEEYYDAMEKMALNSGTEVIVYNENDVVYESGMKRYGNKLLSAVTPKGPYHQNEQSQPNNPSTATQPEQKKISWWELTDEQEISLEGIFISRKDIEMQVESIVYQKLLKTGDIIAIRIIIGAVNDSIAITNTFLLIISLIFLMLTLIATYYFSKKFTDPIIAMQKITTKLSKLEFTESYDENSEDELGMLGKNINILSAELEKNLLELNQKNEQLIVELEKERKLDKLRRTFISNISHELKTPLAIIESYSEGLKLGIAQTKEKQADYSEIIMNEITHMSNLLDSVLDLSQIEAGVLKLNNAVFSVKAQVDKVIMTHKVMAEKKNCNIIFKNDAKNQNDNIFADSMRIQQIIRNYLQNAITHAKAGTDIIIIETVSKTAVKIAIQNQGLQLSDSEIINCWNQFYKKDEARKNNRTLEQQHGLGLSIVKGILDLYPQTKYLARRIDAGMEFSFSFPAIEKEK